MVEESTDSQYYLHACCSKDNWQGKYMIIQNNACGMLEYKMHLGDPYYDIPVLLLT